MAMVQGKNNRCTYSSHVFTKACISWSLLLMPDDIDLWSLCISSSASKTLAMDCKKIIWKQQFNMHECPDDWTYITHTTSILPCFASGTPKCEPSDEKLRHASRIHSSLLRTYPDSHSNATTGVEIRKNYSPASLQELSVEIVEDAAQLTYSQVNRLLSCWRFRGDLSSKAKSQPKQETRKH